MRPENHLRTESEFSLVYRSGKRARLSSVVAISAHSGDGPAKVGFTTSRKIGNAVRRNRARRRMRAAVNPLIPALASGSFVVLQATVATPDVSFQKLEDEIRSGLALSGAVDG